MSAVDAALITTLQGAPAVTSAAPGGVYWDVAPEGTTFPVVIINLQQHDDAYEMAEGHSEDGRYLVKAVGIGSNATAVAVAADAIQATLQDQLLFVPGYDLMVCHREERVRFVEVDGATRYQHRGGIYLVGVSQ
jgi:Protein of unknown function (DUF3168)